MKRSGRKNALYCAHYTKHIVPIKHEVVKKNYANLTEIQITVCRAVAQLGMRNEELGIIENFYQ